MNRQRLMSTNLGVSLNAIWPGGFLPGMINRLGYWKSMAVDFKIKMHFDYEPISRAIKPGYRCLSILNAITKFEPGRRE